MSKLHLFPRSKIYSLVYEFFSGVLTPLGNPQRPMMQNNQQSANVSPNASGQGTPRRGASTALNTPGTPIPGLFPGQTPPKSPIRSPGSARKRIKLEEKPPSSMEIGETRKRIIDYKIRKLAELKENYNDHLTEMFFLQSGLNIMDYPTWKKRPTVQLVQFLKSGNLDSDDEEFPQEKKINDEVMAVLCMNKFEMNLSSFLKCSCCSVVGESLNHKWWYYTSSYSCCDLNTASCSGHSNASTRSLLKICIMKTFLGKAG